LYSHEKKMVLPLVLSSTILFFIGVAFSYFVVIPALTRFIVAVSPASVSAAPDIEQYFGTVLTLFLIFGIAFEVPVAVVVLARLGVVSIEQLKQYRGYYIVAAAIVSAVVTPPERPAAASITSISKSLAAAASPMMGGALFAAGFEAWPLVICGVLKILYDLALLWMYRHIKPPEEQQGN